MLKIPNEKYVNWEGVTGKSQSYIGKMENIHSLLGITRTLSTSLCVRKEGISIFKQKTALAPS